MRQLENKAILVTGASGGIGSAAASMFAEAGAKVILSDIEPVVGQRVRDQIRAAGGIAEFVPTDSVHGERCSRIDRASSRLVWAARRRVQQCRRRATRQATY